MTTKRQLLDWYDDGVRLSAGPVGNHRNDGNGNVCALGALEYGASGRQLYGEECDLTDLLYSLPSELPTWINHRVAELARCGAAIYDGRNLESTLASVFNAAFVIDPESAFSVARAWLDKELSRLVDEGLVEEG